MANHREYTAHSNQRVCSSGAWYGTSGPFSGASWGSPQRSLKTLRPHPLFKQCLGPVHALWGICEYTLSTEVWYYWARNKLVSHTTPLAVPYSSFRYRADTKRVYHVLSYPKLVSSFLSCAKVPWPQGFDLLLPLRSDSSVVTYTAYPRQLSSLPSSTSSNVTSSLSPSQRQQILYSKSHYTCYIPDLTFLSP